MSQSPSFSPSCRAFRWLSWYVTLLVIVIESRPCWSYSLQGKNVLVTGSAGGIGKGLALELAGQGANILVHYHTRKHQAHELANELGKQCLGVIHCDFRQPETIPIMMRQVESCCSDQGLDVLVNNAGAVSKLALEDDTDSLTIWHETMAVNLHAPNLLSRLVVQQMKAKKNRGGVIINVSSIHSDRSNEYMGAYAASKAALDSLTRTMALEYAENGVRVNAIAPGVVPVERTAETFADPEARSPWEDCTALNRMGTVQEVAQACLGLIENDWVTGSIWQVDGGLMARANMPSRERPLPP